MLRVMAVLVCVLAGCEDAQESEISPEHSSVTVDRTAGIVADGDDAVRITVTLAAGDGTPLPGRLVTIEASDRVAVGSLAPTDRGGETTTTITSTLAGTKTLTVTVAGASPVTLEAPMIEFVPGPVTAMMFVDQPGTGEVGSYLAPVQIAFIDAFQNVVISQTAPIEVTLLPNQGNATLSGQRTEVAVAGIATFDQLVLDAAGTGLVLQAEAAAVDAVQSAPFDVHYGPPSNLSALAVSPVSAIADGVSAVSVVATLRSSNGTLMPNQPVTINVSGSGNALYPAASGLTDAQGQFVTSLTSLVAEDKTVTLTAGSLMLTAIAKFEVAPCTPRLPGLPSMYLKNMGQVTAMLAANVDNDGHRDLAVVENQTLAILRGVGNGTFHAPVRYVVGEGASAIASADFDQDGDVDLVVTSSWEMSMYIFTNQGNGIFVPSTITTPTGLLAIAADDVDGNATPDIVARSQLEVYVYSGSGNGTFLAPVMYGLGLPPYSTSAASLAIAHIDNDSVVDIFTNDSNGYYTVLRGTGNGAFQPLTAVYTALSTYNALGVGDFDGDSKTDVVVSLHVLRGNGDGTFANAVNLDAFRTGHSVLVADLDSDGKQDIVAGSSGPGVYAAEVFMGNGDATFASSRLAALNGIPRALAIADFDADGQLDIAAAQSSGSTLPTTLSILLGSATGELAGAKLMGDRVGPGRAMFWGLAADFDGNTTLDFVARNDVTETTGIQLSAPDGTLTAMPTHPLAAAYEGAARDFNGDGKLDLLALGGMGVHFLAGNGDGTLQAAVDSSLPGGWALSLEVADLDGDTTMDLAVVNPISNTVTVAFGAGNGTWSNPVQYTVGTYPQDVAIADLDGDGDVDLVVANRKSSELSVLLNAGNGAFAAPVSYAVGTPYSIAIADLDGDTKLDLAIADATSTFAFLRGNGNGTFAPAVQINNGQPIYWIGTLDVDADGATDVIGWGAGLLVIRNIGNATFLPPLLYDTGPSGHPAIDDFDRDGMLDLMFPQGDTAQPGFKLLHARGCQ